MPLYETADGATIHYEDWGNGHPLVLIHGWAMSSKVWAFQRDLAETCRVVAVDLRGHGRSSTPAEGFSLKDLAGDLVLLFDRLGLDQAIVLGWSLGSQVALQASFPLHDRLLSLILVGGTPRFTGTSGYDAGLDPREVRGLELRLKRDYEATMGDFFRRMFVPGELSRQQETRVARQVVVGSRLPDPAVAQAGLSLLVEEDLRSFLPQVDLPVLLLHGDGDRICPPAAAHYLAAYLPHSRLAMLPAAGHAPFLSRPDEFNSLVREYMQEIHGND